MLEAKIIVVADTVEAMSSQRPYRPPLPFGDALAEIKRGAGTAYDPAVASALQSLWRKNMIPLDAA